MKKLTTHFIAVLLGILLFLIFTEINNQRSYLLEIGQDGRKFYVEDTVSKDGSSYLLARFYLRDKSFMYIKGWESPKWDGVSPLGYRKFTSSCSPIGATILGHAPGEAVTTGDHLYTIIELEDTTIVLDGRVIVGYLASPSQVTGDNYTVVSHIPINKLKLIK